MNRFPAWRNWFLGSLNGLCTVPHGSFELGQGGGLNSTSFIFTSLSKPLHLPSATLHVQLFYLYIAPRPSSLLYRLCISSVVKNNYVGKNEILPVWPRTIPHRRKVRCRAPWGTDSRLVPLTWNRVGTKLVNLMLLAIFKHSFFIVELCCDGEIQGLYAYTVLRIFFTQF
jgi:hypothetical protein